MTTLVIGGAASGKSEIAETLALALGSPRIYVATMEPFDQEGRERVARHHALRQGRGFVTVERYRGLAGLDLPPRGVVLLECLTTLLAGEMFAPDGAGGEAAQAVLQGVYALERQASHLVVVTGDVFRGGGRYEGGTRSYVANLAEINRVLAARFDRVIEAVCGIAVHMKGGCA